MGFTQGPFCVVFAWMDESPSDFSRSMASVGRPWYVRQSVAGQW